MPERFELKKWFSRISRVDYLWYLGIPIFVAIITYAPYLLIQCGSGMESCWRIPVVGKVIFDLYAYMAFMGRSIVGADSGLVGLFRPVVLVVSGFFPNASIPELWLVLRWISGVLSWWVCAWMIGVVVPSAFAKRRFISTLFWISVCLPLGFRPGIYSWLLPFTLVSIAGCALVWRRLEAKQYVASIGLSIVSILTSVFYIWTFIFVAIWLTGAWAIYLISRNSIKTSVLLILGLILASIGFVLSFSYFVPLISFIPSYDLFVREGLAFTRAPALSVMFFAGFGFLTLMYCLAKSKSIIVNVHASEFFMITFGWLVVLFAWLSNVFTSVYLQNDHFRTFVMLWGVVTTAFIFSRNWNPEKILSTDKNSIQARWVGACLLAVSGGLIGKYILAPYAFNGDQLNVVHVFVCAMLLFSVLYFFWGVLVPSRRSGFVFLMVSLCIGMLPYGYMFVRESHVLLNQRIELLDSIRWIQSNVGTKEGICVDPRLAEVVSGLSKRRTFFSIEDLYVRMTDEELYGQIAYTGQWVAPESKKEIGDIWTGFLQERGIACAQFAKVRSMTNRLGLNFSFGCDADALRRDETAVRNALQQSENLQVIDQACSYLYIPEKYASSWNTSNLKRTYRDQSVSIYQLP